MKFYNGIFTVFIFVIRDMNMVHMLYTNTHNTYNVVVFNFVVQTYLRNTIYPLWQFYCMCYIRNFL